MKLLRIGLGMALLGGIGMSGVLTGCRSTVEPWRTFERRPQENPWARTAPPRVDPAPPPWVSPTGVEVALTPREFGERSPEGRTLHYWVLGEGDETILILGGTHGNEQTSAQLSFEFVNWLEDHPPLLENRQVVIAPLVNPDGYEIARRENARGVDLNRNFPASNWKPRHQVGSHHRPGPYPRSEPETRFVMFLIDRYPPDRIVSIHGAASCVNWDGPAQGLASAMSRDCGLPPKASIGYPTPGSFGSWMGKENQVPTITLELRDNRQLRQPEETYFQALATALCYPQSVPSETLELAR